MPFDLRDDAARLRPASGLIREVRVGPAHFKGRGADRMFEQIADAFLQAAEVSISRISAHTSQP